MEKCHQIHWSVFDEFCINIPCLAIYFLEVGARLSLKVALRVSFRCKEKIKQKE